LLKKNGAYHEAILQASRCARQPARYLAESESTYAALEKVRARPDELARRSKLDPVIGRDEEIRRVMQILARRTRTIPC